jgi:hypothetical protein
VTADAAEFVHQVIREATNGPQVIQDRFGQQAVVISVPAYERLRAPAVAAGVATQTRRPTRAERRRAAAQRRREQEEAERIERAARRAQHELNHARKRAGKGRGIKRTGFVFSPPPSPTQTLMYK